MNSMPLISVVVPVYNVEKYINRCVMSLLNQTYKNLEIILVDDGSSDVSGRLCDEFAKIDKRVQVVHKENGGVSSARNAGLKLATGDYIGFADSDDYCDINMYAQMIKVLKATSAQIVCCKYNIVKNGIIEKFEYSGVYKCCGLDEATEILNKDDEYKNMVWCKLFKKNIWEELRFKEGICFEDVEIMQKLFNRCDKITFYDKPVYNYVQRDDSLVHLPSLKTALHAVMAYETRYTDILNISATMDANVKSQIIRFLLDAEKVRVYQTGDTEKARNLLQSKFKKYDYAGLWKRLPNRKLKLAYWIFKISPMFTGIYYRLSIVS